MCRKPARLISQWWGVQDINTNAYVLALALEGHSEGILKKIFLFLPLSPILTAMLTLGGQIDKKGNTNVYFEHQIVVHV